MQKWILQPSNSLLMLGDFNANYYVFPYEVDSDVEIVIKGQFPYARYISFTLSGQMDNVIATASDRLLIPDPGSTNPFLPCSDWNAKNRNYTIKILPTAPPEGSEHFVPEAGNNTFYAGTLKDGTPNKFGLIGFRIYVPSIGYDKTGGVGLPKITYCSTKKNCRNTRTYKTVNKTTNPEIPSTPTNIFDKELFSERCNNIVGQNCDLIWSRIGVIATRILQPDLNTVYILSDQIKRDPDNLLFIRWKAPTFPDTYHNIGISGHEDMRYWSMSFITKVGLLGLYTLSDFQTVTDKNGYVNLVISFGAPRPSCVTTENGFNWIDASELPLVPLTLFYRNNQVSQSFPYTAKNVPEGQIVPPEVMGEYYPCGKYVAPFYFDPCYCHYNDGHDNDNYSC
ncbi:hypothetical protein SAMN02745163_02636 [Clostridium cavendishii DSM 21758]|uniref:Uncharacterized protein n=1 Tax=Clostridium cavendishii DSM 21758 TaxID=1121302 RepID=A0A1M6MHA1_9CLOT|nr:hypothetical protein [Clostridium cavendishii]SHJ82827.1 hypothetical protein SAMN02745163_02636 [Clostridium cavendishii DSM 21758]